MTALQKNQRQPAISAGIILSLFLFIFASLFFTKLLKFTSLDNATIFFFSRLIFWICLFIVYLYAIKAEKSALLLWTEKKYSFLFYLLSIVVMLVIIATGIGIISRILLSYGLLKPSDKLSGFLLIFRANKLLLIFTCLTAGVTEELIFRGYLMPRLKIIFKKPSISIVLSALFFGLAHIGYGTIGQVTGPTFIG